LLRNFFLLQVELHVDETEEDGDHSQDSSSVTEEYEEAAPLPEENSSCVEFHDASSSLGDERQGRGISEETADMRQQMEDTPSVWIDGMPDQSLWHR